MAKNDDLTALFKAFMESRTDTAEDKDELKLRIKDLDRTLKEITQFFKTQGLYSKELGVILKQAIEVEKQEVKRKKGSGQGLPRMVSDMHLDSIIKKAIEGSLKGSLGAFNTKSQNKLLQDSIKAIKDNQNAYEKLSNSLTGLQKSVADLGGKLAVLMGTSGGSKDSAGGSGLGALAAALGGHGKNGKDPDLKSAVPKGNGFMKGISTLIGFLGNKSGSGFLGKLGGLLADYAKGVGWDILKLAAYSLISLARNFGPSVLKPFKWLAMGGSILSGALKGGTSRGLMSAFRALRQGGTAAKVAKAAKLGVKAGAKWGAKTAAKKIPGLSLAAGIGFGAARWAEGDKFGAVMEIVSGIAACFPGIGTAISAVIDIGLGVKDFFNWKKKKDDTVGKSVDSLSKDIDDRGKEQKGFWENFCNWIKDHWGMLAGFATGGTVGAIGGAVIDHFRNKGNSGGGGPSYEGEHNTGERAAKSFKERRKAAENYYNQQMLSVLGSGTLKEQAEKADKLESKLSEEIRKKFGVIMGGGMTPWLGAVDAWDGLKGNTVSGVLKNADPSALATSSSIGASVGTSAVNNTPIGAGQTYSGSSTAGSKLGGAFLGIHDTISTGGGFNQWRPKSNRYHRGIDLPYPEGTDVRAFLGGKVVYAGWMDGGFGNVVAIENEANGKKWANIYGHLQSVNVSKGQYVSRNKEIIGKSGKTGGNYDPHLHFEVRPKATVKGGATDPVAYVASALGYSVNSLPDSGPMFAGSSSPSGSARAASEPKGIYNEGEGDIVASAGESGESIEQTLKNAYANNQFDQTGNVQFLSAINSIRVQLGKYQQIGYVN